MDEILRNIKDGGSGQHAAERVRQRRAITAEAGHARERYAADGYAVTDTLPDGAMYLNSLRDDHVVLTPEMHASCPGRGIVIQDWDPEGAPFCSSPDTHGHAYRFAGTDTEAEKNAGTTSAEDGTPDLPSRRLVREGNLAWLAAGKVRGEFLKTLCGRATIPRDAQLFAAKQILTMPPTVAAKLSTARNEALFRELTNSITEDRLDGCKPGRLPVTQLALVLTAYEVLLTQRPRQGLLAPGSRTPFPAPHPGRRGRLLRAAGRPRLPAVHDRAGHGRTHPLHRRTGPGRARRPGDRRLTVRARPGPSAVDGRPQRPGPVSSQGSPVSFQGSPA